MRGNLVNNMAAMHMTLLVVTVVASVRAQQSCEYTVSGAALRSSGVIRLGDGTEWLFTDEGLSLIFNDTITLHSITINARHSEMQTNLLVIDRRNERRHNMQMNIPVDGNTVELPLNEQMDMLTIEGVRGMEEDDSITVIACPSSCHIVQPCYGRCAHAIRGNCMTCVCPKDSVSSGCGGYTRMRDLHLLYALVKRKTTGCQFVNGFRRSSAGECEPFSYPRCHWFSPIIIPKTVDECETNCMIHS